MFHHKQLKPFWPVPWQAIIGGMIAANTGVALTILEMCRQSGG